MIPGIKNLFNIHIQVFCVHSDKTSSLNRRGKYFCPAILDRLEVCSPNEQILSDLAERNVLFFTGFPYNLTDRFCHEFIIKDKRSAGALLTFLLIEYEISVNLVFFSRNEFLGISFLRFLLRSFHNNFFTFTMNDDSYSRNNINGQADSDRMFTQGTNRLNF